MLLHNGRYDLCNGQSLALGGLVVALVVLDAVKGLHRDCKLPIDHGLGVMCH